MILRTAHHHGCGYEWGHHTVIGRRLGLTDEDVAAAQSGFAADEFDQAVFHAVDELHSGSRISPATWTVLGERLDDQQRMDLMFTVGGYGTLALALNTFDVQLEADAGNEQLYTEMGS